MKIGSFTSLMLTFMVFGFFGTANTGIPFGEDDELYVHLNILSDQDEDIDDASLRTFVYGTGQFSPSQKLDVDVNDIDSQTIRYDHWHQDNDFEPVRVVIQNNDMRAVKHVWAWMGTY